MSTRAGAILGVMDESADELLPVTSPLPEDEVDVYELRARTVAKLEELLEDAQAEIELMRGSMSWRITAPLRAAGRVARRLIGRR